MYSEPERFYSEGKPYELLQYYFSDLSLETLRPALRSSNPHLNRSALFIASELGIRATDLIDDVLPLAEAEDPRAQWDAMEILSVCGTGPHADRFLPVVRMLDGRDSRLRRLAERLMSRADPTQVAVAREYFQGRGEQDRVDRWTKNNNSSDDQ